MNRTQRKIIRHLTHPTRGGSAGALIALAFFVFIYFKVALAGLPEPFLTSWSSIRLLPAQPRGSQIPRAAHFGRTELESLHEQRPLVEMAILGLFYVTAKFVSQPMGLIAADFMSVFPYYSSPPLWQFAGCKAMY